MPVASISALLTASRSLRKTLQAWCLVTIALASLASVNDPKHDSSLMKYQSPLLSTASGSVAGLTFSHNSGGQYIRRRVVPINPNTDAQGNARNNLADCVSTWTNILDLAQRLAWKSYADSTPVTDKLGMPIILSGQQMFIKMNTVRKIFGLSIMLDGPHDSGLGLTPGWTTDPVVNDNSTVSGVVTVDGAGILGDVGIYLSEPVMPSRTVSHATRRAIDKEGPPTAGVFTISMSSVGIYDYTEGQKVRVTAVYLSDDGRVSAEAFQDVTVSPA